MNFIGKTDIEKVKTEAIDMQRKLRRRHRNYLIVCIVGGLLGFSGLGPVSWIGGFIAVIGFMNEGRVMFTQGVIEGYRNGYIDASSQSPSTVPSLEYYNQTSDLDQIGYKGVAGP